jgi:hypothetical protein
MVYLNAALSKVNATRENKIISFAAMNFERTKLPAQGQTRNNVALRQRGKICAGVEFV